MKNKNRTATIDWILQRDWELDLTLTLKKDCTEHRDWGWWWIISKGFGPTQAPGEVEELW